MNAGPLKRAQLVPEDGSSPALDLHYNPSSLTLKAGARWSQEPTRGAAVAAEPEFTGTEPVTLTMDVLLDAIDDPSRDVGKAVAQLLEWTRSSETSRRRNTPQPPLLMLRWGGEEYGPLYITSLTVDHTLFAPSGVPLRAMVKMRLTEAARAPKRTNPTSGGPTGRRRAVLGGADGLATIAQREYGDPNLWRAVAIANGIDDPGRVPAGTSLLLPSMAEARELAGGRRA